MQNIQGIIYRADGSVKGTYTVPRESDLFAQVDAGAGEVGYPLPEGTLNTIPYDLSVLRNFKKQQIDAQAGAVRSRFITTVPGQESTYLYKAAEAKAWTDSADPADFPMLSAEAAATGVTMGELAATVRANADLWTAIGARIEAARLAAKQAITAAEDIPAIFIAATVDWEAVVNG